MFVYKHKKWPKQKGQRFTSWLAETSKWTQSISFWWRSSLNFNAYNPTWRQVSKKKEHIRPRGSKIKQIGTSHTLPPKKTITLQMLKTKQHNQLSSNNCVKLWQHFCSGAITKSEPNWTISRLIYRLMKTNKHEWCTQVTLHPRTGLNHNDWTISPVFYVSF